VNTLYLDSTVRAWIIALLILILGFGALVLIHRIVYSRLKRLSQLTVTIVDDLFCEILGATQRFFLFAVALYAASFALKLSPDLRLFLYRSCIIICLIQASFWGSRGISFWINGYLKKRYVSDSTVATSLGLIGFTAKFGLFALLVLMAIHNLGFDITTLIAGLGVGGIAVALAVQNILADLFASLTIVLDKPFVIGDFIVVGEYMGTIEHIGLKTTRIRSLSGEQLVFANGDLLQSRVRNFKRMSERRIVFTLGVVYQTSQEKLAKIPEIIKDVITITENARIDRCHFLKFGASSLDFETVYWVASPDFNIYADIAQKINLEIFRRFAAEGIEFAYPSQTLYIQRPDKE
jgi:small-conductance mechanosensitive channel